MPTITQSVVLRKIEHILVSSTGTLDFAVDDEDTPYTWHGVEDAEWTVDDVSTVKNVEEDRFAMYPEDDYFVCEIEADGEEFNFGPVHCYCE